tara:strand:- start:659 stop:871 length:213 start_codon:yes stop_codon:yes gene_type:complete
MIEPITDLEIEEVKARARRDARINNAVIVVTVLTLLVTFITCSFIVLGWYALALYCGLVGINLISRKNAN